MQPRSSIGARAFPAAPGAQLLCRDPRCRTLLPAHAEICDECGGTDVAPFQGPRVDGAIDDRPVGFILSSDAPNVIGRSPDEGATVDLARFGEGGSVHRRHAEIRNESGRWRVTHHGTNPLVVQRGQERITIAPHASADLRSGDRVIVGAVPLRFST